MRRTWLCPEGTPGPPDARDAPFRGPAVQAALADGMARLGDTALALDMIQGFFGMKDLREAKALLGELCELAPRAAVAFTAVRDNASPG